MLAECLSIRSRTWRCLLVLLVAVAGIVTGILAMHVVNTPVSQPHEFAASQPATSAAAGAAHMAHSHPAAFAPAMTDAGTTSGCAAGDCDPMHDMTAMVCTLALLAATILLVAPALSRMLLGLGTRAAPTNRARMIARTVGSPPPSLLALSIDRR